MAQPRQLTSEDRKEIADRLESGIRQGLGVAGDLFQDRPGFIAGGGGDWPLAGAVRAVSQYNCRVWARSDKANNSTRVNQGNAELCGPYLESIGESVPDGSIQKPFTGGQCAGTIYAISGTQTDGGGVFCSDGSPIGSFTGDITNFVGGLFTGPIVSVKTEGLGVGCRGDSAGYGIRIISAGGSVNQFFQVAGLDTNRTYRGFSASATFTAVSGPDDCGDPPPEITPPGTPTGLPTLPPDITVNIPGFGPVNVTVSPDDDGDPIICILDGETCFKIDIDGGGGGGGDLPIAPGDQGEPGDGGSTGEGGETDGEAPPGSVLVGLRMELMQAPEGKEYAPGVYRGGAYIYMGGDAGLDQDFSGSMLADGQFVFAEKENLTRWRVRANTGYNWMVIPYYREAEA